MKAKKTDDRMHDYFYCVILRHLYSLNPLISLMRDKIILQLQLIMPGSVSMTLCRKCSNLLLDEAMACT